MHIMIGSVQWKHCLKFNRDSHSRRKHWWSQSNKCTSRSHWKQDHFWQEHSFWITLHLFIHWPPSSCINHYLVGIWVKKTFAHVKLKIKSNLINISHLATRQPLMPESSLFNYFCLLVGAVAHAYMCCRPNAPPRHPPTHVYLHVLGKAHYPHCIALT